MEQKKRRTLALLIAAIIIMAVFSSFTFNFLLNKTPQVTLPSVTTGTTGGDSSAPGSEGDGSIMVDVTPQTVQSIIATLSRASSYSRTFTIERFWGEDDSSLTAVKVWADSGYTRIESTLLAGRVQYVLVNDSSFYLWYSGSGNSYLSGPADELSADLAQSIPTYEDVLKLDPDTISSTDCEEKDGFPCIYVEVNEDEFGYLVRYWIDLKSGLLVYSETLKNGTVVYRMSGCSAIESPCPSSASFALPDGTKLHEMAG